MIQALGHVWNTDIANYTLTFPLTDYSQVAETYSQVQWVRNKKKNIPLFTSLSINVGLLTNLHTKS